jgi:hypothetical protein
MKYTVSAFQEKVDAWTAEVRAWQKETMACQEVKEAYPQKMKSIAVSEEVAVKPVRGLKKQQLRNRDEVGRPPAGDDPLYRRGTK